MLKWMPKKRCSVTTIGVRRDTCAFQRKRTPVPIISGHSFQSKADKFVICLQLLFWGSMTGRLAGIISSEFGMSTGLLASEVELAGN